ncbi:hypothetical protein [Caldilinea sp.]|uniref:hypothetical protein n=1 Tax=Caldilinea sp. TaxID=2293560 RepID=UPI002B815D56|nr:hypothetical protein [Caldilinea sp.]HRA64564.1 hypothetical protein [Caldilinea sp.]
MSDLYALLIGIDDYDDREVHGIRYPKLGGAVRDIERVHSFLRNSLHVPDVRILKLTAARLAAGAPTGIAARADYRRTRHDPLRA